MASSTNLYSQTTNHSRFQYKSAISRYFFSINMLQYESNIYFCPVIEKEQCSAILVHNIRMQRSR
ncbi:hypothetical protein Barb4_02024 [Bacteroidales bacterium Barb4]|nr:hypothetical protein Barb4_02024 [Bacteroidales bacterium Barb4]